MITDILTDHPLSIRALNDLLAEGWLYVGQESVMDSLHEMALAEDAERSQLSYRVMIRSYPTDGGSDYIVRERSRWTDARLAQDAANRVLLELLAFMGTSTVDVDARGVVTVRSADSLRYHTISVELG